jgi:DnaK suppressor protein
VRWTLNGSSGKMSGLLKPDRAVLGVLPDMSTTNLNKYREILEKKKEELMAAAPVRTPAAEPGSKSGDWIDQSSQESDLHVRLALKQTDSKLLRAIEEAIHRIDNGTYGICMECENEIAPARLEAVPWTRVCIDCKAKQSG